MQKYVKINKISIDNNNNMWYYIYKIKKENKWRT